MNAGQVLAILESALWSSIAATAFAILFNVPRRTLVGCAIAGVSGHAVRTLCIDVIGLPIEAATLAGATVVGFLGVMLARRLRAPVPIFTVSGAIPMVPGVFAYSAMLALVRVTTSDPAVGSALLVEASINIIKTSLILAAIAAGISLPALLFQRHRPVV